MCLLDQKNKVTEKERQLYAAEVKKDEMWRKYQQMKMEKDELEMELKPGKYCWSGNFGVGLFWPLYENDAEFILLCEIFYSLASNVFNCFWKSGWNELKMYSDDIFKACFSLKKK